MTRSILLLLVLASAGTVGATPPRTLDYQGVLEAAQGGPVADGDYSMVFALYAVPTGGTAIWSEPHTVTVSGGRFDVVLGSITALDGLLFEDPYWLGLTVGADPEMTPRTELTGTAYAQIARRVEAESITSDRIAPGTVVRSINGYTESITVVGGDNVDVSNSRGTITISATNGGGEAPGVASAKGVTSGSLGSSIVNLASRSITCPADGYVLVIGSCDVFLTHSSGNPTYAQVGVSDTPSALQTNQDITAQIPFSAASGTYTLPLTSHGIFPVSAGSHTFYLVGESDSVSGTASAGNRQLSLLFVETSYGTVSPLSLPGEGDPSGEASGNEGRVR